MFVVQNNHFRGQALANALQMRHLIEGERPEAPEELVATYPDLERDVTVRRVVFISSGSVYSAASISLI